jgi:hypothetical protein
VHSAPHHGAGRSMKVGKEEAIGMLTAVEMWVKRDHEAEWDRWTGWLDHIARRVSTVPGVTTLVVQPEGLSNRTPSLRVLWERERLGVAGEAIARELLGGDPRIALFPARDEETGRTGVAVTPYMLAAGEERIVADRLHALLARPPRREAAPSPAAPAADLSGQWDVRIEYAAGQARHTLHLRQRGAEIDGAHRGEFVTRDLTGRIEGSQVRLHSLLGEESGDALSYEFSGEVTGDEMAGRLDMGEYLGAAWTARRRG